MIHCPSCGWWHPLDEKCRPLENPAELRMTRSRNTKTGSIDFYAFDSDHKDGVLLLRLLLSAADADPKLLEDVEKALTEHMSRQVAEATGEPEEKTRLGTVKPDEQTH